MNVNLEGLPAMLEKVTLASLIPALIYLVLGFFLLKLVLKGSEKALSKSSIDKTLHKFILTIMNIVLYFILFMTVADALGVQITSFVALLSVAGLAVSMSLQGVLSNVACGISILSERPFKVGDYVEVGGVQGTVQEIGIAHSKINTVDNKIIFIPNSDISAGKIINYTCEQLRRVDHIVCASYDCDIEVVKKAILEAIASLPKALQEPAPFVRVDAYKESVQFVVRTWCKTADYWDVYYDLLEAIPVFYKKHGVRMSYPHVNVHMIENK